VPPLRSAPTEHVAPPGSDGGHPEVETRGAEHQKPNGTLGRLPIEPASEVEALIDALQSVSERLEHLTEGQVDAVVDRRGRTFVLGSAQTEMRNSDAVQREAIINALPAHIALLATDGTILAVNAAWRAFADKHLLAMADEGVGSSYLGACDAVSGCDAGQAQAAASGIRSVLEGRAADFVLEYPCATPDGDLWFRMHVSPINPMRLDGAVVVHENVTEEKLAETKLRESELRFRQIAESIHEAFFLQDAVSGEMLYVSPAYENIWGRSCASLYADPHSWMEAVVPEDLPPTQARLARAFETRDFALDYRIRRPDGSLRWIEFRGFAILDEEKRIARIAGVASDVTERMTAATRIAQLNRVYAMVSGINSIIVRAVNREDLFAGVCQVAIDAGGFQVAWIGIVDRSSTSLSLVAKAGVGLGFLDRMDFSLLPESPLGQGPRARALSTRQTQVSNDMNVDHSAFFSKEHAAAGIRSLAIVPLVVANESVGMLALYAREPEFFHADELKLLADLGRDVAYGIDHIDKRERLDYLSYYDVLTGLANRTLFLERVAQHMLSAGRDRHQLALFVLDLERFKNFNDTLGQLAGDELLRAVGHWFSRAAGDASFVARLGADRFAVVAPKVREGGNVVHLLEKMLRSFAAAPFVVQGVSARIAFRVGAAVFPDDGDNAETLFRYAESALKNAKASGARYLFYTARMSAHLEGSLTLENRLRRAIDRDEFVLCYQPKVNLQTGKLTGAEALIRWNDPETGLVPPGRFIPVLEETGLIHEVGRWALRRALQDAARWRSTGRTTVPIAVNVSALQLRNPGFLADMKQALASSPVSGGGLDIEVTESLIMEDARNGSAHLQAIRAMGVHIAIDDFGTGYSSLSYLARLPVDSLKIDRSFVTDMTSSQEGLLLVSTIITLAHSLRLNVIAEGVETEEQARLLRLLNCDEMQGFLICRPIPPDEFEARYLCADPGATWMLAAKA
jgi:diguanylate cyclase (GGDEF)-like protein/PAS domain S-box-containing protein